MLNRRTIRIKIMQSLFAYEQCKEADYQLALDLIDERFLPDLNSMEVQDKDLLKKQAKAAKQLFEKKFNGEEPKSASEKKIEVAVKEAESLYAKQIKKDEQFLGNNIILEIEKLTEIYLSVLSLVLAFVEAAESDKKLNHTNFIHHPLIEALRASDSLKKEVLKGNFGWQNSMEKVRGWFRDVVKEDKSYMEFIENANLDEEMQKAFMKHLTRKIILGSSTINDYYEEQDIRWAEDKDIVKSLVDKTVKSFSDGKIELQKMSLDWEDDKDFIKRLFKDTIDLDKEYKDLIAKNTRNWEVDRLPLTDRIILEMAIAEMLNFPNIPVKVTINEYIELTKEYSTPKSRQFINGILDVISKNLKDSGTIKKSGRGLIDNK